MFEVPIEPGKVREFALAVEAPTARHYGADAVVTPTFLTIAGLAWEPAAEKAALDFDLSRTLHGSEEYEFPAGLPRAGQTLSVTTRVERRFERAGERGGQLWFAVVAREFRDTAGELVAVQRSTAIELGDVPAEKS